jgi:acyl-coenzyme A synthetase/AMP-(fatty) acid ligase
MSKLAFLRHTDAQAVIALQGATSISLAQFCADVDRLTAILPDAKYVLIGCEDRYQFAVCFAAALARDQIAVLPHNHLPHTLEQLTRSYSGLYCVAPAEAAPLPILRIPFPPGFAQVRAKERNSPNIPNFASEQIAAILFTSGSTGVPQAHPRTWGSIVASAKAQAQRLFGTGPMRSWSIVGTVPAQHSYGFESTVHLALQGHGILVSERPFFPADVMLRLSQVPAPRLLVTTPVHLRALTQEAATVSVDANMVLSATAPLPASLAHEVEHRLSCEVHEIYGSTESGQVASRRTLDGDTWQTLPGVQFLPDPQLTSRAWASGGHVQEPTLLGDHLLLKSATTFALIGRTTDVVNIGGKRASIDALNHALQNIPGVVDGSFCLFDQEPSINLRLTAFVVAPTLNPQKLRAALREKIEAAFMPRPLYFVDQLPRDANGKLPVQQLQALAKRQT